MNELSKSVSDLRIIVFGTGEYYKKKAEFLKKYIIVAFINNDEKSWGTKIDEVEIVSPLSIIEFDYDFVCVVSSYQDEIFDQLFDIGVPSSKILGFNELGVLEGEANYDNKHELDEADILVFSHLMNYTGAPIALYNMVRVITTMGYRCVVLTIFDGPLRQEYLKIGVPVYEENNMGPRNSALIGLVANKRMIVCNTIFLRTFVEYIQFIGTPVIWWIHESLDIVGCRFASYKMNISKNLHICAVGRNAKEMLREKLSCYDSQNLLYMVDENMMSPKNNMNNGLVFAVIGNVTHYKGQDIFVDSILLLPEELRSKCKFIIVGANGSEYGRRIKEKAEEIPELRITGAQDRKAIRRLYGEIDVVVCPSRIDTMPTVVVEGMMNKKCCVVSDVVGIVDYITDMTNGIIFRNLSPKELMEKMKWIIDHSNKSEEIGRNSYEIYRNYFSETTFVTNIYDNIMIYSKNK